MFSFTFLKFFLFFKQSNLFVICKPPHNKFGSWWKLCTHRASPQHGGLSSLMQGCPGHYRGRAWPPLLNAGRSPHCDDHRCLHTSPNVPWGQSRAGGGDRGTEMVPRFLPGASLTERPEFSRAPRRVCSAASFSCSSGFTACAPLTFLLIPTCKTTFLTLSVAACVSQVP